MRARIQISSFHWAIVEQTADPQIIVLMGIDESFNLTGLSGEQVEFRVKRITSQVETLEYLGPILTLIPENKLIGEGQARTEFSLLPGESRKLVTPTLDAGIVWDIRLLEVI